MHIASKEVQTICRTKHTSDWHWDCEKGKIEQLPRDKIKLLGGDYYPN